MLDIFKIPFTDRDFIENAILCDIEPYFAYDNGVTNKIEGYTYKVMLIGNKIRDVVEFKIPGACKLKSEEYEGKMLVPVKLTGIFIKFFQMRDTKEVRIQTKFDTIEVLKTPEAKAFDVLFNK